MGAEDSPRGSVGLCTLGCKVSQYETEAIGEEFIRRGFAVRPFDGVCDIYVINTCTVTAESDRKSRQMIRRAVKRNPGAVICVTGCYSQMSPEDIKSIGGVSVITGSRDKLRTVDLAVRAFSERDEDGIYVSCRPVDNREFENMSITTAPRTRVYVKIEDGCESKCTYCRISGARGHVCSKPPEDVIREVEALHKQGTREIVLTGIEVAAYGADFDTRYGLSDLICELAARGSCERIRLGSLAPELCGERFAAGISGCRILAPHFHISMQSGSDSVLRAMKRRYTRETALRNIEGLRRAVPGAQFTSDLMVGFPGESEEDFLATLSFVKEAGLLDAHVFAYSRRPGTPAAEYPDQIPEPVKRERSARLIAGKNRMRDEVLAGLVAAGEPLSAIFETRDGDFFTAHAANYAEIRVRCSRDLHGEMLPVRPLYAEDGIIYGELL